MFHPLTPMLGREIIVHNNGAPVIIKGLLGLLLDLITSHSAPLGEGSRSESGVRSE